MCNKTAWRKIVKKAREQAEKGDRHARDWLSRQFGTEAPQRIEQKVQVQALAHVAIPVEQDPELEALVRAAATRIFAPAPPALPEAPCAATDARP